MDRVGQWAAGNSYGPVLSQTDLYLLKDVQLKIHPILLNQDDSFQISFNMSTGRSYTSYSEEHTLPFTSKDEPATLPRVSELMLITKASPWMTVVKNPDGVVLADIFEALYKDYQNEVTQREFEALSPRSQDILRRYTAQRAQSGVWSGQPYPPQYSPNRFKRYDWLLDKQYFDSMEREDRYAIQRLGFAAPNIFVVAFSGF
ncbi:hypothetical protein K474DRAFT_1738810 [Panus rudis PR-1116 ss-1]|nr:hypothetical protein K474DRAFT_1738810 [Panus rudis PR-1116 ss-1]